MEPSIPCKLLVVVQVKRDPLGLLRLASVSACRAICLSAAHQDYLIYPQGDTMYVKCLTASRPGPRSYNRYGVERRRSLACCENPLRVGWCLFICDGVYRERHVRCLVLGLPILPGSLKLSWSSARGLYQGPPLCTKSKLRFKSPAHPS